SVLFVDTIHYGQTLDYLHLFYEAEGDGNIILGKIEWDKSIPYIPSVAYAKENAVSATFIPDNKDLWQETRFSFNITVNPAEYPPNPPGAIIYSPYTASSLEGLELPANWEWVNKNTPLKVGVPVTAEAVYKGSDAGAGNFIHEKVLVTVTRNACGHPKNKCELINVLAPTCTEEGYTGDTFCTDCKTITEVGKVIKAAGHSYKDEVTAPTCTEGGYTKHTCTVCGSSYTDSKTAAAGHSYGTWQTVKAATCTAEGSEQHTCSKCGNKETRAIAAAGHSYKDVVTAPTCTKEGYTTHTCTKCNNSYTDNKTAATGHSYKDVVTAPTCTEEGYTTHACNKCGSSYIDTKTAATGHSYEEEIVAPTPTAGGYVKHTCTKCGQSYNDSYTSVLADVNNDKSVNAIDAKWILQYVSGSRTFTAEQMMVADVNGDGQVNAIDAKWILQIASGSRKLASGAPKAIHSKARVLVTNL
ncbi:MAG: dockerin type I repeat-containing protein, partial [Ruminiclostridium sp.]|nr:dockerin type I repeat-containing protein [Ruminiclostridium sp.]